MEMKEICRDKFDFTENKRKKFPLSLLWKVSPKVLKNRYDGVASEKFGTVDIKLSEKVIYNIADLHYPVGTGKLGMYLLPVSDEQPIVVLGDLHDTPDSSL